MGKLSTFLKNACNGAESIAGGICNCNKNPKLKNQLPWVGRNLIARQRMQHQREPTVRLRQLNQPITHDDHQVSYYTFARRWSVETANTAAALTLDNISFETLTIIYVDHLYLFIFKQFHGFHHFLIQRQTPLVAQIGFRNLCVVNLRSQYLYHHSIHCLINLKNRVRRIAPIDYLNMSKKRIYSFPVLPFSSANLSPYLQIDGKTFCCRWQACIVLADHISDFA